MRDGMPVSVVTRMDRRTTAPARPHQVKRPGKRYSWSLHLVMLTESREHLDGAAPVVLAQVVVPVTMESTAG